MMNIRDESTFEVLRIKSYESGRLNTQINHLL